jgi:hypothetical protein
MIKNLNKLKKGIVEETYLNIIKTICDKPKPSILEGEKLKVSSTFKNETRASTLSTFIQHSAILLAGELRQEKEIIGLQIEKEVKLSPFQVLCS